MYRRAFFEALEPRLTLTAPTLSAISDVTMTAGIPMYVALDGYDADGDTLSFSATSTNSALTGSVPTGNRFMRISVAGYGDMVFELFEDMAPNTTGRIIQLAESGFYAGVKFHRILKDFVIQGGDPTGTGSGGSTLGDIDDEFNANLRHSCAGILSMAKSTDDTNDSQFFITNAATPSLDFQHSVFGFLTEGDDVRKAIAAVDVTSNGSETSKPVTDVVMQSVTIFTDPDSGVLILKAASNFTGTTTVTVNVSDGHGGTAQQSFHVTVNAPSSSYDPAPYIAAIQPIHIKAGQQYTFGIPGVDANGSPIYYSSTITSSTSGLTTSTTQSTGQTTLVASSTAAGVYSLRLRVASSTSYLALADSYSYYHDTQMVPVYVSPAAPTLDLIAGSDSGTSDSDNITNLDNTAGKTLHFRVSGVVNGAVVKVYADGSSTPIGQGTASGTEVTIETNGTLDLTDGTHTFTATQELDNQTVSVGNTSDVVNLVSTASSGLAVTVDTTSPQFTSTPLASALQGVAYVYNAETNEEAAGNIRYSLTQTVTGMSINQLTGQITWTPTAGQAGTHDITIHATDLAGQTVDQTFQVTATAAATVQSVADQSLTEGQTLSLTVTATDTLLPLSYGLENAPSGATINATTGALSWTPSEAQGPGQFTITVAVTNSAGAVGRTSFAVTVAEQNTAPQLAAIADATIAEGQAFTFQAAVTDTDLPANTLTFSLANGAPAGATINAQTGVLSWTPSESQGGASYAITVLVSDGAGGTASQSFHVTVTEVDNAPVFNAIADQSVAVGQTLQLSLQATDPDLPNPQTVVYSLEAGAPQGVTINAETGALSWTIPESYAGTTVILTIRATEVAAPGQTALSSTQSVQVQIAESTKIVDRLWQTAGQRASDSGSSLAGLVDRTVVALQLPWLESLPVFDLPTTLSGNVSLESIFGHWIEAQGGGSGIVRPQPPSSDRIEVLHEASARGSASHWESGFGDVSFLEDQDVRWQQVSEAVDKILGLLGQETPSATSDAELAEADLAEVDLEPADLA